MSHGKGAISKRTVHKILTNNGYEIVRKNKHIVYSNGKNTIAIPSSYCTYVIKRLFKENNIKEDLK